MIDEVYMLQYHGSGIEPNTVSICTDVTRSMNHATAHALAVGVSTNEHKWEYVDSKVVSSYPHLVARIAGLYTIERFRLNESG